MFGAILLSQFNSCPGITIATDDVITATDDVITTTDDVIHTICIDLEGKHCFVKMVGSFQLKNAFSETGYPAFY